MKRVLRAWSVDSTGAFVLYELMSLLFCFVRAAVLDSVGAGTSLGVFRRLSCAPLCSGSQTCTSNPASLAGVYVASTRISERLVEYGWDPYRFVRHKKAFHGPQLTCIGIKKKRGTVSSSSTFQTALIQKYSAKLSIKATPNHDIIQDATSPPTYTYDRYEKRD